jgi:hypothetical protein
MARIVRLTESDLTRLVRRVIKEQGSKFKEGGQDPQTKEGGQDEDHFGKYVLPQMKAAGFKLVDESKSNPLTMCKHYNGNCCKYFAYPEHNNGVNLFLSCEDGGWKYVVYTHPGGKNLKEFGWKTGTDQEVKSAAQNAVRYAIQLKNTMFGVKKVMK